MEHKKLSTRDLCSIGVFTAMIAVSGQISIPMPYGVPMTLQTLIIPLAGMILGTKKGTLAALIYVLLGAVGAPVFAGFTGGIGMLLGVRGGFILSFPLLAFTGGMGAGKNSKAWLGCWLVAGSALNYLCGMLVFRLVMMCDVRTAFVECVLPFIPTAVVKIVLVGMVGVRLKNAMTRVGVAV